MGMKTSAQAFQRWVDSVVRDLPGVFAYMDDLLVFSDDHKTHQDILIKLFQRLDDAGLTISAKKCQFGVDSLDYLGVYYKSKWIDPH